MQKRSWLILASAFAAAILGVLLRWYQLAQVYDPVSAMPRAGSLASMVLALLPLLLAAVLFPLLRPMKKSLPAAGMDALAAGKTLLTPILSAVLGLVVCAAGVLMLRDTYLYPFPSLRQIIALFTVAAGIALAAMGFLARRSEKSIACPAFVVPSVLFCLFLIIFYKENQNDPVVWDYAPETLAIALNALSFFFLAGFVFHRPRPVQTVLFCLLAFAASITCLTDGLPLSETLLFAAIGLANLLFAVTVMENADHLRAPEAKE